MAFGRDSNQPEGGESPSQQLFVGRKDIVAQYVQNLRLQTIASGKKPIVSISGIGGVGKTSLVNELMKVGSSDIIYTEVDASDNIGDDITQLLTVLCYKARQAGKPITFKRTLKKLARRRELISGVLQGAADIPKPIAELLYSAVQLTAGVLGGPVSSGLVNSLFPQEPFVQLAGSVFERFAKVRKEKEGYELLVETKRTLTGAFVDDINELAGKRPFVIVIDDFEKLASQLNPWILKNLLDDFGEQIECDLRFLVAGRNELVATDARWHDVWRTQGLLLELKLEPFSDEEVAEYLKVNCQIESEQATRRVTDFTSGLPLWVSLWAAGGAQLDKYESVHDLATVTDRIMRWLPSDKEQEWLEVAACCWWFNEDVLASVLGKENSKQAFAWLRAQGSGVQSYADGWKLHDVIRDAVEGYLKRRSEKNWRGVHQTIADYFQSLQVARAANRTRMKQRYQDIAWLRYILLELFHRVRGNGEDNTVLNLFAGFFIESLEYQQTFLNDLVRTQELAGATHEVYAILQRIRVAFVNRDWMQLGEMLQNISCLVEFSLHQQSIIFNWIGYTFERRQMWADALNWYDQAEKANPKHPSVLLDRSNVLLALGDVTAAREAYVRGRMLDDSTEEAILNSAGREGAIRAIQSLSANNEPQIWSSNGEGGLGKTYLLDNAIRDVSKNFLVKGYFLDEKGHSLDEAAKLHDEMHEIFVKSNAATISPPQVTSKVAAKKHPKGKKRNNKRR